jgi:unsaturated rhamnogalacturonyl hydrolase
MLPPRPSITVTTAPRLLRRLLAACGLACLLAAPLLQAQTWTVGMSSTRKPIVAYSVPAQEGNAPDILVIGGFSGERASTNVVMTGYDAYANEGENFLNVTYLPAANPDAEKLVFPPSGTAYNDNWTSWALWQWIGTHAPDAVVIVGGDIHNLGPALRDGIHGLGSIPVFSLDYENELIDAMRGRKNVPLSAARKALQERRARSAEELAAGLAGVYGQQLEALTYIPGMALIGRLRLGQLAAVEAIVAPRLDAIEQMEISSSLQIAGHLLFAELAERTQNPRYLAIAKRAAELGFAADGSPLDAMPFHGEYSDAFFMAAPLLAKVGKLSNDSRYYDLILNHVNFLQDLLARDDGLYRHWPRTDAAWARGNAFVALGLALALSDTPAEHPAHARMLELLQKLATTLLQYQDVDGMWHNIVDMPGSWAEFSATAMFATALQRGAREGWLPEFFDGVADRAWEGLLTRTDTDYGFIDVSESTPGQETFDAYLQRRALSGRDDRAGGMLLYFATERLQD